MLPLCVLLALVPAPAKPGDEYPPRLRNILESRQAKTSQVEWTVSWIGGRDAGLVERYVTRNVGDTWWESNLGDENGYHPTSYGTDRGDKDVPPQQEVTEEERRRRREIPKEESAGTHNALVSDGQAWYLPHVERPLVGVIQPLESAASYLPVDLPSIGLAPRWKPGLDANPFLLPNALFEGFDTATFREGRENGLPTLSAEWGGGSRLTWRFDDRFGGEPVWAGFEQNGELISYSETEYERSGERWFPKSVRFYEGDSASPYKMIDVQRATFDEPWHMQEITPAHIGALNGTQFAGPDGYKTWTGVELIPTKEYWDLVEIYDVPEDPRITEMRVGPEKMLEFGQWRRDYIAGRREAYKKKHGEEPWLGKKPGKEKDEWDVYVEKFLAEHKLPAPGVKRAHEIRDQAKKLRDAYRRKNRAAIKEAKEKNDQRKIEHYEGLEKRIFDQVLVRDLKKLVHDDKAASKKTP